MTAAVDIIGALHVPPSALGEVPTPLTGFHVNITPAVLSGRPELEAFVVNPAALRRVWAGDSPTAPTETVALRFADEAEALGFFPAD